MTLAITGGTGFVGHALIERAVAAGLDVVALARKPQPEQPGVTWIVGDLADTAALEHLARRAEAIIHVAGAVSAPDAQAFEDANVSGTLNVIVAARATGVPRLIHVSSLSAREPDLSLYGASKARAEKMVMASGLDWTIVRPPAIYGPRDREMFELFRAARWGVLPMPKDGHASLIHVDDLARLLLALVPGNRLVSLHTFEPDDGQPGGWSHYELARAIGWAVGRRPLIVGLSGRTMGWAARADRALRGRKAKLTADRVGYMTHPDWVASTDGAVPSVLWEPQIETRQGLRDTALWYRAERWL